MECGCLSSPDSQSEGGTVTVSARSARGGRVPVKILTQWKEGIEVMSVASSCSSYGPLHEPTKILTSMFDFSSLPIHVHRVQKVPRARSAVASSTSWAHLEGRSMPVLWRVIQQQAMLQRLLPGTPGTDWSWLFPSRT